MNRHVNAIANRLSLRPPQRRSLEILDRITEIAPPGKDADAATVLEVIRGEFPTVTDFERDFPSLCFALVTQTVQHFRSYLSDEDAAKVLRCYQRDIVRFIHVQMQEHYWEETAGHDIVVSKGFNELKPRNYSQPEEASMLDFRESPADKSNMARYLFTGFSRCLYPEEKFQSEPERKLAVILERDAIKWFRPARGQFQIFYRYGADHLEYQPDFVAETAEAAFMLEAKAGSQMDDPVVLAKKDVAVKWCANATAHAQSYGGKPWRYLLIPHDQIAVNVSLAALVARFGC